MAKEKNGLLRTIFILLAITAIIIGGGLAFAEAKYGNGIRQNEKDIDSVQQTQVEQLKFLHVIDKNQGIIMHKMKLTPVKVEDEFPE